MKPLTLEEIERMFGEMGLETEEKRMAFLKQFDQPLETKPQEKPNIITHTDNATENGEICNAQLA